jgi:hypothetical protein
MAGYLGTFLGTLDSLTCILPLCMEVPFKLQSSFFLQLLVLLNTTISLAKHMCEFKVIFIL